MCEHADTETKQPFINIVRQSSRRSSSARHPAISRHHLRSMAGSLPFSRRWKRRRSLEKRFEALQRHDYLERLRAGSIDTAQKRKKLLDAYAEELFEKRLEWVHIQVSVVAGAGFEPAAFRL